MIISAASFIHIQSKQSSYPKLTSGPCVAMIDLSFPSKQAVTLYKVYNHSGQCKVGVRLGLSQIHNCACIVRCYLIK